MTVELVYVSHDRLEFTEATLAALLENTNWALVAKLHVLDDHSTDGTHEYLAGAVRVAPVPTRFESGKFGGPVGAMNDALDHAKADVLCKVDSDFLVCPGWLDVLAGVMDSEPRMDVLGLEAGFGGRLVEAGDEFGYLPARHVGGIGLFRTRMFSRRRPRGHGAGGRFGWTQFQVEHRGLKGWLTPDLPCVALDRLPFEPWRSLTERYVAQGAQRRWPEYPAAMHGYWDWWLKQAAA